MSASTSSIDLETRGKVPAWQFARETRDGSGGWQVEWQLKRHCALSHLQMLGFFAVLCVFSLAVASFFWHQGARMIMSFAWLELIAVGVAMFIHARHAADGEHIALQRGTLVVEHACGKRVERVEFQSAWVRVEPRSGDRSLIELSGQGRRIAIGRFIRPELRRKLADELRMALRRPPQAVQAI